MHVQQNIKFVYSYIYANSCKKENVFLRFHGKQWLRERTAMYRCMYIVHLVGISDDRTVA